MKNKIQFLFIFLLFLSSPAWGESFSVGRYACTEKETWEMGERLSRFVSKDFHHYLKYNVNPPMNYAISVGLIRSKKTPLSVKIFGLYWRSLVLYREGLTHLAANGFNAVLNKRLNQETLGVHLASLQCLNKIQSKYPRIHIERKDWSKFKTYYNLSKSAPFQGFSPTILNEAVYRILLTIPPQSNREKEYRKWANLLRDHPPYRHFARGRWYSAMDEPEKAVRELSKFLKTSQSSGTLPRLKDSLSLTLARNFYLLRNYPAAEKALMKVSRDSNLMVRVLSELSWVQLMQKKYKKAVGTALNLQSGGFHHSFSPEGSVVLSMTFNELCQFPSSFRTARFFYQAYRKPYFWLKKSSQKGRLYPLIVRHLENPDQTKVPKRILSEWLSSPVFISNQEEINLFEDQREMMAQFSSKLKEEYHQSREASEDLKDERQELSKRRNVARLNEEDQKNWKTIKRKELRVRYLQSAIRQFKRQKALFQKKSKEIRPFLIREIEEDLRERNLRMFAKLKEMAETLYLIKIEIYEGASEDVVWQNAHPGYKKFLAREKQEALSKNAEKSWNWGKAPVNSDGTVELWQDELRTLMANLNDVCSAKDRYLAVQIQKE